MSGKVYGEQFAMIPDSVIHAPISANAFRLFATLQRHAGVVGHCYPGRNRLAEIMGCSHDTISRAKKELVEAGLITCVERFDEGGRRTTDDIFLHPPRRNPAEYVRRNPAEYVRRNPASAEVEEEEPELDELEVDRRKTEPAPAREPTDTTPFVEDPEPTRRERNLAWVRAIRAGLATPFDVDLREDDAETA